MGFDVLREYTCTVVDIDSDRFHIRFQDNSTATLPISHLSDHHRQHLNIGDSFRWIIGTNRENKFRFDNHPPEPRGNAMHMTPLNEDIVVDLDTLIAVRKEEPKEESILVVLVNLRDVEEPIEILRTRNPELADEVKNIIVERARGQDEEYYYTPPVVEEAARRINESNSQ